MDLALNNLHGLICLKTQTTNQPTKVHCSSSPPQSQHFHSLFWFITITTSASSHCILVRHHHDLSISTVVRHHHDLSISTVFRHHHQLGISTVVHHHHDLGISTVVRHHHQLGIFTINYGSSPSWYRHLHNLLMFVIIMISSSLQSSVVHHHHDLSKNIWSSWIEHKKYSKTFVSPSYRYCKKHFEFDKICHLVNKSKRFCSRYN